MTLEIVDTLRYIILNNNMHTYAYINSQRELFKCIHPFRFYSLLCDFNCIPEMNVISWVQCVCEYQHEKNEEHTKQYD